MFKGFFCHITGEPRSPEACLACCRQGGLIDTQGLPCPFTEPILRGLIESHQPRGLLGYSATEISGCLRKIRLQEETDYYVHPRQAYWAFRGRLIHALLEQAYAGDPAVLTEHRFYADIDGQLFTGQIDLYEPEPQRLVDYKTTREVPKPLKRYTCPCGTVLRETPWEYHKGAQVTCPACGQEWPAESLTPQVMPPQPYPSHVRQLNLYAWLLVRNGYPVRQAELVYLDMSEPLRLPVALWPLEETERYLKARLAALHQVGPDGFPTGVKDDPAENWLCRFCPVAETCFRLASENGNSRSMPAE